MPLRRLDQATTLTWPYKMQHQQLCNSNSCNCLWYTGILLVYYTGILHLFKAWKCLEICFSSDVLVSGLSLIYNLVKYSLKLYMPSPWSLKSFTTNPPQQQFRTDKQRPTSLSVSNSLSTYLPDQ